MDRLVRAAVFGDGDEKHARWLVGSWLRRSGFARRRSRMYMARGRGETRASPSRPSMFGARRDDTRAVNFPHRQQAQGGRLPPRDRAFRSPTPTSAQRSTSPSCLPRRSAGIRGPVFIQGDHFQVSVKKYAVDPTTEVEAVKALANEPSRPASTTSTSTPRRSSIFRRPRSGAAAAQLRGRHRHSHDRASDRAKGCNGVRGR